MRHGEHCRICSLSPCTTTQPSELRLRATFVLFLVVFIVDGWLVALRIYVALVVFQPYRDLETGDNQSLKFKWRDRESNPGPLAPQAKSLTTRPPPLPRDPL